MQLNRFLHTFVEKSLPKIHKIRLSSLLSAVHSLLDNGKLTLTSLGRNMTGAAYVKHKIKKVDRLLSNEKLLSERFYVYKELSGKILKSLQEAIIIVDWSGCCSQQRWILQASIVMSGRSIPLYKEIHPLKLISNPVVERDFLQSLYKIVPKHVRVVIVTDAGFRTPWFKQVRKLGWDFVGRVRGRTFLYFECGDILQVRDFIGRLKNTPIFIGNSRLGANIEPMHASIYGYCSEPKGRKKRHRKYYNDGHPDKNEKYGRANKEPWILATSLPGSKQYSRKIINIYKNRMQIEQNFRDLKNQRHGFGLRDSRTENIKRLEIMLLIAFIATLILWLIAATAERYNLHRRFQANTKNDGRAISLFFLGWQVIKHGINDEIRFNLDKGLDQLPRIQNEAIYA